MKYTYFFLFFLFFFNLDFLSANQEEREKRSENITILDTEDVEKIINSKSAILIDVWKKDTKPEKLDPKKDGVRFGHSVGTKKRKEIVAKAVEKKFKIFNARVSVIGS